MMDYLSLESIMASMSSSMTESASLLLRLETTGFLTKRHSSHLCRTKPFSSRRKKQHNSQGNYGDGDDNQCQGEEEKKCQDVQRRRHQEPWADPLVGLVAMCVASLEKICAAAVFHRPKAIQPTVIGKPYKSWRDALVGLASGPCGVHVVCVVSVHVASVVSTWFIAWHRGMQREALPIYHPSAPQKTTTNTPTTFK